MTASIQVSALEDANLSEEADLIVEQVLLHNLTVLPVRDGTELQLERLAGRVMHRAVQSFPRADHLPPPARDSTCPVTRSKHHAVRVVLKVIFNRLEERLRLRLVGIAAHCRVRLAGPVNPGICRMALSKYFPVLRVPRVVERFHPL